MSIPRVYNGVMPYGPSPKPLPERFWAKVDRRGPDECWPWLGHQNPDGYGRVYVNAAKGPVLAHRVAWEMEHGETVPDGLFVCHRCDNPPCCNPADLFVGTHQENNADMQAKGRTPRTAGDRNGKSKITEAAVAELRRKWATGGYTQAQLGQECGLHPATVSRIVRGLRR
jgi:hypothetical protein